MLLQAADTGVFQQMLGSYSTCIRQMLLSQDGKQLVDGLCAACGMFTDSYASHRRSSSDFGLSGSYQNRPNMPCTCAGYECMETENGDFMFAFDTPVCAVNFCLQVGPEHPPLTGPIWLHLPVSAGCTQEATSMQETALTMKMDSCRFLVCSDSGII